MSTPIVSVLNAINEYSASEVTPQPAFLLSNNEEVWRQFNLPDGWTELKLTFKVSLYSANLPQSDLTNTRFLAELCSINRSLGFPSNEHFVGVSWSDDSMNPGTWDVNGNGSGGDNSGSMNTYKTNPENCAWEACPYVGRGTSYVTGSHQGSGLGWSGDFFPFYATVWSSSYTASNGYPLHSISGYAWSLVSLLFIKNASSNANGVQVNRRSKAFSSVVGATSYQTYYNCGINVPRAVTRRAMISDDPTISFYDYKNWQDWYLDTTLDNNASVFSNSDGNFRRVDEAAYGPLDCVNFSWICTNPNVKLAIRDVAVVKVR